MSIGAVLPDDAASQTELVADFVYGLRPSSVLDAGCAGVALVLALADRGIEAVGVDRDQIAVMQLDRRFDVVVLSGEVVTHDEVRVRRDELHSCVQHLVPSGAVVSGVTLEHGRSQAGLVRLDELFIDCDLHLDQRWGGWDRQPETGGALVVSVHRRTARFNVHDLLYEARISIRRVTSAELFASIGGSRPPLVVDTRSEGDRARFGVVDGAIHVPRTVIEWHLDPANGYRHRSVPSFDQPIVVVCNDGYSSSLSAANLVRIGFTDVADLTGGMAAWRLAGLPTVAPNEVGHNALF